MRKYLILLLFTLALPNAVNANLKEQFNQKNDPRKALNNICMGYFNRAQYEDVSGENRYLIEGDNDIWYVQGPSNSIVGHVCTYQLIGVLNKNFTFDVCKVDGNLPYFSCNWHLSKIQEGWGGVSTKYTTYFEIQGDNLVKYDQMGSNEIHEFKFKKIKK